MKNFKTKSKLIFEELTENVISPTIVDRVDEALYKENS